MRNTLLIILLFALPWQLFSKNVVFSVDGAAFRYDSSSVIWEMYYSFPDTLLKYKLVNNSEYLGELLISVAINSNQKEEAKETWIVTNKSKKPIETFKSNLVGQKNFVLEPGLYTVNLTVKDVNDTNTFSQKTFPLKLPVISNNKISISNIELATVIESEKDASNKWNRMFYKNSLFVIPNPILEFYSKEPFC